MKSAEQDQSAIESRVSEMGLVELEGKILAEIREQASKIPDDLGDGTGECFLVKSSSRRVVVYDSDLTVNSVREFNHTTDIGPNQYNLIQVNGRLTFVDGGRIETKQNLAIRATEIMADSRELIPDLAHISSVSASGSDGTNYRGKKAARGPDGARNGDPGANARPTDLIGSGADDGGDGGRGDHGNPGSDGRHGGPGEHGENSANFSIVADRFDRDCWLMISSRGGHGGNGGYGEAGGDGGNGKTGGPGGKGGKATIFHTAGRGGNGGPGGDSGQGGRGGDAGRGGDGGGGGNVTVRYLESFARPRLCEIFPFGGQQGLAGEPGAAGANGEVGSGGEKGTGGDAKEPWHGPGGFGSPGSPGGTKPAPLAGEPSRHGTEGKEGSRNGGVRWERDPPIWPYSDLLSEAKLREMLNV